MMIRKSTIHVIVILAMTLPTLTVRADDAGMTWLKKISDAETVDHAYTTMRQTITTSTGEERTFDIRSWSAEEGDVSLMAYDEPRRVKDDKILMRDGGDNIWYYMKRRDVTRHFTGSSRRQKVMGSDFSYEDVATGDMEEDYTAELLGEEECEEVRCVKLRLVPTESGPSYDHLVLWAGKEDLLTRQIDYYDEDGLMKTLTISDFREVDGRKLAFHLEMVNHRDNSKTTMVTTSIDLATKPDPSLFSKASLTKDLR